MHPFNSRSSSNHQLTVPSFPENPKPAMVYSSLSSSMLFGSKKRKGEEMMNKILKKIYKIDPELVQRSYLILGGLWMEELEHQQQPEPELELQLEPEPEAEEEFDEHEEEEDELPLMELAKGNVASMVHKVQIGKDKWNMCLDMTNFEEILLGFTENNEAEDVKKAIPVNAYDRDGRLFPMMLKKCKRACNNQSSYVLNRGWFTFCQEHGLREDDFVAFRTFRDKGNDALSMFVITYR